MAEDPEGYYSRAEVSQMTGIKYSTLTHIGKRDGWTWAAPRKRSGVPPNCEGCEWPGHERCSSRQCMCEQEIPVLGQPESKLWSANGGQAALEMAY